MHQLQKANVENVIVQEVHSTTVSRVALDVLSEELLQQMCESENLLHEQEVVTMYCTVY